MTLGKDVANRAEQLKAIAAAKEIVEKKVSQCIDLANEFFKSNMPLPMVKFNQRGRAAGTAYLQRNEVRFNYYMYQQNPDLFVEQVVPHEIAHLVVFNLYGANVRPHGAEWKQIMLGLYQIPASRTHAFAPEPPKKVFDYSCDCQKHQLSVRRHNRIVQGARYVCKRCGTTLTLIP